MDDLKPNIVVSRDAAQKICERLHPQCRVSSVSKIHGGEIAAVLAITFTGGQHPLILKVYPDSLRWKMRKEAAIIALVEGKLRLPAPRVLMCDDSKEILGLNYLVMSKLKGTVLGNLERSLSADHMKAAYRQIGELLRDFHAIPMEAFGYIGETGIAHKHAANRAYLTHLFERKLAEFARLGGGTTLAQRIAAHVAEREHLFGDGIAPCLCHNDLHAGNIVADFVGGEIKLTGVMDFEGALAGDPLFDVAKAMFYLKPPQKAALREGYGRMERDRCDDTLDLYHLYFTLELWCWFSQIGASDRLADLSRSLEHAVVGKLS